MKNDKFKEYSEMRDNTIDEICAALNCKRYDVLHYLGSNSDYDLLVLRDFVRRYGVFPQ